MLSNSKVPKCVVLMASYNGIPFISEQIDSILSQAEVDVRLFVRDDGSSVVLVIFCSAMQMRAV